MSVIYTLQSIMMPNDLICLEEQLFYRILSDHRVYYDYTAHSLHLGAYSTVAFSTYFNAFSIRKWKQYTTLGKLQLRLTYQGHGQLLLINDDRIGGIISHHIVAAFTLESDKKTTQVFEFKAFEARGLHSFTLETCDHGLILYNGCYETELDQQPEQKKIAVNICTYHRESYVLRNFHLIADYIESNKMSYIGKQIDFYIVDNGETLDPSKLGVPSVHFFSQKDSGSTGGFTRGLMEILDQQDERQYQYVLFMDDDVLFYPEILDRTDVFLTLLKPHYEEYILAGSMLRIDLPVIQTESGGRVNENPYLSLNAFLNMGDLPSLLFNDLDQCADVSAWWYAVTPMIHINEHNLPFPYFFHREDMDYCHRLGGRVITLSGIGLWHEPFEYKIAAWHQYYDNRNLLIFNSLHYPNYKANSAKNRFWRLMLRSIFCYRYKECRFIYEAVEDFCKGPDWLLEHDTAENLEEKCSTSYKFIPLNIPVGEENLIRPRVYIENRKQRFIRLISINGYMLPANHDAFASSAGIPSWVSYRVKRLYNVNANEKKYYVVKKSYLEALQSFRLALKARIMLTRYYGNISTTYRKKMPEMITSSYWKRKLELFETKVEK